MSKLCNPDAMTPAIGTNYGSGTGSVVSSASISVLPCLLPASTGGGNEPDCEHNTNRLLRGPELDTLSVGFTGRVMHNSIVHAVTHSRDPIWAQRKEHHRLKNR